MRVTQAPRKPLRVLFVCTENAGRSQIAEALLRGKGDAAFKVASAGPHPASHVNPLVADVLREHAIDVPIDKLEQAALEHRSQAPRPD